MSGITIVQIFGDLLGTYGDNGNAVVLERRAQWRDLPVSVIEVGAADPIPDDGDIYVIGGGEDGPQHRATRLLADSGALGRAVDRGAAVLAVCAGFQLLGTSFLGPRGEPNEGLGLLDVVSHRTAGERIVGEIVIDTVSSLAIGPLTGYENHAGVTTLGPDAQPLGRVLLGADRVSKASTTTRDEGAWQGRVLGTYLHGPVLARNPALADQLLAWALDVEREELVPLDDRDIDALRRERLAVRDQPRATGINLWRAIRSRR